ncbi:hypothetical protein K501DRAFT_334087 [Backusella circina FSU 941]|nr:hypothetical protein K501DRAFT_334087 [Backusella circina FSU 941]
MLTHFPLEILLNVTGRLSLHDKLTLILTCHKLGNFITDNCLYETLNIREQDMTETIITKFKNREFNSSQVKELKLYFDILSDDIFCQLPNIFPNVNRVVNHSDTEGPRDYDTAKKLLKWRDTLRYYDTRDGLFKIGRLLETNVFSNLKYIHLSPYFLLDLRMHKTNLKLLECISHAPMLESLELYLCEIDLEFLESTHASCPYLKTLALEKVLVTIRDESLQQIVEPASDLVCLKISSDSVISDPHFLFPAYICRKYPNLQALELVSKFDRYDLEEILVEFFSPGEEEGVHFNPLARYYMDNHAGTVNAYKEKGSGFISKLPKSIAILKLHSEIFDSVVPDIRISGLQLSTFEMTDFNREYLGTNAFDHDEDLEFITSQISLKTLKFATNTMRRCVSPFVVSSSVTKLCFIVSLNSFCDRMCVAWVLSAFPSIKKLDIYSDDPFSCEVNVDTFEPNYNLKELNINYTSTNSKILNVIGTLAPNIKHLSYGLKEFTDGPTVDESERDYYNYPVSTNSEYGTETYYVDITNFDLDTFRLNCDMGSNAESGAIDIYFEIVRKSQVKRVILSSCRKYITVIKDKENPILKKKSKVKVSCNKIKTLILENVVSVTFKDDEISLTL